MSALVSPPESRLNHNPAHTSIHTSAHTAHTPPTPPFTPPLTPPPIPRPHPARSLQPAAIQARARPLRRYDGRGINFEKLDADYDPRKDTCLSAFVRLLAGPASA